MSRHGTQARDADLARLIRHYAERLNDALRRADAAGLVVDAWAEGDQVRVSVARYCEARLPVPPLATVEITVNTAHRSSARGKSQRNSQRN